MKNFLSFFSKKKGQVGINDLPNIAIALLVIGILVVVGSNILAGFAETDCTNYWDGAACWNNSSKNFIVGTTSYNVSATGLTSMANLTNQLPLIATTAGLLVVLGFVLLVFRNEI